MITSWTLQHAQPQHLLLSRTLCWKMTTLNPQVDDVNLDASSEHSVVEPTSELTDLPDMCSTKELVSDTSAQSILDIGEIYCKANSPAKFTTAIQSLTTAQKYELLTRHKVPHKSYIFPTHFVGGCNRSFRLNWLSEHMAGIQ